MSSFLGPHLLRTLPFLEGAGLRDTQSCTGVMSDQRRGGDRGAVLTHVCPRSSLSLSRAGLKEANDIVLYLKPLRVLLEEMEQADFPAVRGQPRGRRAGAGLGSRRAGVRGDGAGL